MLDLSRDFLLTSAVDLQLRFSKISASLMYSRCSAIRSKMCYVRIRH